MSRPRLVLSFAAMAAVLFLTGRAILRLVESTTLMVGTAVILAVISLPLSYWVAFSKWRWKFLIEAIVALPIVLPPTVLACVESARR